MSEQTIYFMYYSIVKSVSLMSILQPCFCSAALDSKSEKVVVNALRSAMKRTRCMLMITHRLGVVRSLGVNKVVVLEQGQIVEVGHPEELLKSDGMYSQLAREQGILPLHVSKAGNENMTAPYL